MSRLLRASAETLMIASGRPLSLSAAVLWSKEAA